MQTQAVLKKKETNKTKTKQKQNKKTKQKKNEKGLTTTLSVSPGNRVLT